MNFIVWFELYDKKMKVTIEAKDKVDARIKIRNSIKFHKTEQEEDNVLDFLKDTFGMS